MTDTAPPDAAVRRWPRWKSSLLVASLALNLLVVGVVATVGLRHGFAPPPAAGQTTVLNFARSLPPDRKAMIWNATREERRALRPFWAELRKGRANVRAALTAEPFDPARYKAAHDQLLEAELRVRKAAHSLVELVATRLSPEERRAFAHWQQMTERPWRRRGHRGQKDADDDIPAETERAAPSPAKPADSRP